MDELTGVRKSVAERRRALRGGWPPIAVRPEDRPAYLAGLEEAQLSGDDRSYRLLMLQRLDATLADYVGVLSEAIV